MMRDFGNWLSDTPLAVLGIIVLVFVLAFGGLYELDRRAEQKCVAHGGRYVQTGTTPMVTTVMAGKTAISTVSEVPVYSCVGSR